MLDRWSSGRTIYPRLIQSTIIVIFISFISKLTFQYKAIKSSNGEQYCKKPMEVLNNA